jgi:glycine/D-amino acid oxidase-like deaminating enzyme
VHIVDVDVLIIGGGIMGLWLLNDLRRPPHSYSTVLLEKGLLGGEQTCHSHVYIHGGYAYNDKDLTCGLRDVRQKWEDWLKGHDDLYWSYESYWGFTNESVALRKTALWTDADVGLSFEHRSDRGDWPRAIADGKIQVLFRTPERCLDGHRLVTALAAGVQPLTNRIQEVVSIELEDLEREYPRVRQVQVVMPDGQLVAFRPRSLILTAGAGNSLLLDLASVGRHSLLAKFTGHQQIRKGHMLIVKGKDLPHLTGVFPDLGGLFIVSRRIEDETIWLVSDHRSPPVPTTEDWIQSSTSAWLPRVIAYLRVLAPHPFRRLSQLRWAVYEAPKAEGRAVGRLPTEERIIRFGDNFWAIWPSKLTLAPLASEKILKEILREVQAPPASRPITVPGGKFPGIAPERWTKFFAVSWQQFCETFGLEGLDDELGTRV